MRESRAFIQVLLIFKTIYIGKAIFQTIYLKKYIKLYIKNVVEKKYSIEGSTGVLIQGDKYWMTSIIPEQGRKFRFDLDYKKIGTNKFYYDVIYNPTETNFLKEAKKLGNKTENGKKMFIFQAAEAFKIWHDIQPEINEEVSKLLD